MDMHRQSGEDSRTVSRYDRWHPLNDERFACTAIWRLQPNEISDFRLYYKQIRLLDGDNHSFVHDPWDTSAYLVTKLRQSDNGMYDRMFCFPAGFNSLCNEAN